MENIFKSILDSLKLTEDDDYDDYEDEKEYTRAEKVEKKTVRPAYQPAYETEMPSQTINNAINEARREKPGKTDREKTSQSKVVPIRTSPKGFEVCIMKPSTFEDSQEICDMLLSGRAAVINLEGLDVDLAQRIMDFISGSVYSMNGRLHQISSFIFIISPESVDISGDYSDILQSNGFEVPTLNKDF
ncbi:cell division protein SepF [Anaerocolumna xylanovorans]|uniref:Cell division protein SepF n=1 Tax=Anaerocolumna xylanovorans DSM 12503 TaxID=1121345 RepID=A0A1M7Y226_9FIRM|nr:cell division protein SepF [Anaerocolumna xylanovorans]SHO45876.1 cell division inhibitor SepF [Anaerocolumna xylanovorans DSM 12503]